MGRGEYLGELEIVVLTALLRLGGTPYGMEVYDEIVRVTGRELSAPSVYVTLNRLETKGFVESEIGTASPKPGGRAPRHYSVTDDGRVALDRSRRQFFDLFEGLPEKLVR